MSNSAILSIVSAVLTVGFAARARIREWTRRLERSPSRGKDMGWSR